MKEKEEYMSSPASGVSCHSSDKVCQNRCTIGYTHCNKTSPVGIDAQDCEDEK